MQGGSLYSPFKFPPCFVQASVKFYKVMGHRRVVSVDPLFQIVLHENLPWYAAAAILRRCGHRQQCSMGEMRSLHRL